MHSNSFEQKNSLLAGYTLAIESSGTLCGVALANNGELLAEYYTAKPHLHDALLAEFIRRILADHALKAANISSVVLSAGPGSFTGLRIGAALAKGFCFGTECRLYAIPTLVALAYGAKKNSSSTTERITAMTHSHKNLLYVQDCNFGNEVIVGGVQLLPFEEIDFSSGTDIVASGWSANLPEKPAIVQVLPMRPSYLLHTLQLSPEIFAVQPSTFEPYYGQDFVPKQANTGKNE